jgi:hypothetical protein
MFYPILLLLQLLLPVKSSFIHLWTIPIKGDKITTDNLGNPLVIDKDVLNKYRDNGTFFRTFSNKRLGEISSIDAMNPLKIAVFYKDFSRVLFLDNTLTENGNAIELEKFELEQASLICASYGNGIWVYDGVAYTLTRFNQEMQRNVQILNLNQILGYTPDPKYLMEHENHLYMSVPEKGILQFDIFGTYIRTIPIVGLFKFQVVGNTLFYSQTPGILDAFEMKTLQENRLKLPINDYIDLSINQNRIYLLRKDSLSVFQIPAQLD